MEDKFIKPAFLYISLSLSTCIAIPKALTVLYTAGHTKR